MMSLSRFFVTIAALLWVPLLVFSQVRLMRPQQFKKQLPAGNYSGIAPIGNHRYAVVSDKTAEDGFYIFHLTIDTVKGRVTEAANEGFFSAKSKNRDIEGIAFHPTSHTLFICGEKDNEVYEYSLDGERTGRRLQMTDSYRKCQRNLGLESLAYDTFSHRFYTTSERVVKGDSLLRIQSFDDSLQPREQYLYRPDKPLSKKYYHGVSALCSTGDGRLLVLERQLHVPPLKVGAKCVVRIYEVTPGEQQFLQKKLLTQFTTRNLHFANYEGLCSPFPGWLLLVADSQNQYRGLLRDWFRLVRL